MSLTWREPDYTRAPARVPIYRVVTPADAEPVTTADLKAHLGLPVEDSGRDAELSAMLRAARSAVEAYIEMSLMTTVWRADLSAFAERIRLGKRPFAGVSAIEYVATDGTITTVDDAVYHGVEVDGMAGMIFLGESQEWPSDVATRINAVRVTFSAGFGDEAADVPDDIRVAVLMTAAALDANRGDCGCGSGSGAPTTMHAGGAGMSMGATPQIIPPGALALLGPYRPIRVSIA